MNGFRRLGLAALLPVRFLHELTHVLFALPWAEAWRIEIRADGQTAFVEFEPGAPRWAVWLSHHAPVVMGALVFPVLLASSVGMLVSGPSMTDWLLVMVGFVAWTAYAKPSVSDRNPTGGRYESD